MSPIVRLIINVSCAAIYVTATVSIIFLFSWPLIEKHFWLQNAQERHRHYAISARIAAECPAYECSPERFELILQAEGATPDGPLYQEYAQAYLDANPPTLTTPHTPR